MTNVEYRIKFAEMIATLITHAKNSGIQVMPFSFYRTPEEQNRLYREGKSNADGYNFVSKHQLWRAMDLVIIENEECVWGAIPEYELLGQAWEHIGGRWGGRWSRLKDVYHFEL